ncbi:MAG: PD40 domain-containing protein [Calditrichae bacterium]|nr:PD40 domain-containing protein [Calditrichia bacterium]
MKPIVLFFGAALLFFGGSGAAQNYPVLFTKQVNGTDNIFMITESGERQITDHSRKDSSPLISPDGKMLVFTSERVGWWKIWTMDVAQQSFTQLTNSGNAEYAPCWSPDGQQIAFVSTRDGNAEIYVMAKNGKNLRNISNNPTDDAFPFWGDDGMIYFSSEIDGVFQIVRMKPDGSAKEILAKSNENKLMPQLSPDRKSLLYYSDATGNNDIFTVNTDGSARRQLTKNPLGDIRPRWSPDGKTIVFERGDKRRNQHIFIMDANGENQKQLTFSDYNYAPSFVENCAVLCQK